MKCRIFIFILMALTLMTGCQVLDTGFNKVGYQKIDEANAKIAQVEQAAAKKQEELNIQFNQKMESVRGLMILQMQGAANALFSANYAYSLDLLKDRNDTLVNYYVKNAQEFIKLAPTPEYLAQALIDVKNELDESKTTIADLEKKFANEKAKAEKLAQEKEAALAEAKRIEAEKVKVETEKVTAISQIQVQKDKDIKQALDDQQKSHDELKKKLEEEKNAAHKALVQKLMYWTGGFALAFLIGAVFGPPLFKGECATIAAILGGVTVALPFIETWMVGVAGGTAIVALIAWIIYKHNVKQKEKEALLEKEAKVNKNLVNVIQDVKDHNKDVFDAHLKPALMEWNSIVRLKDDGTIEKIPDKEVMDEIDKKLIAADRK